MIKSLIKVSTLTSFFLLISCAKRSFNAETKSAYDPPPLLLEANSSKVYVEKMKDIYTVLLSRYAKTRNGNFSYQEFAPSRSLFLDKLKVKIDELDAGKPLYELPPKFDKETIINKKRLEFLEWRVGIRKPNVTCMKLEYSRLKNADRELLTYTQYWTDVRDIVFALNGCFEHPYTAWLKSFEGGFDKHIKDPKGKFLLPSTESYVPISHFNKMRALPLYFMGVGTELSITDGYDMDLGSFFFHDWFHGGQMVTNDERRFQKYLEKVMNGTIRNLDKWIDARIKFSECVMTKPVEGLADKSRTMVLFHIFHEQTRSFTKVDFEELANNPFRENYSKTIYVLSGFRKLEGGEFHKVVQLGAKCEDPSLNM